MGKFFLTALLVALMSASTVFAATDAGFTFDETRNQTFLSQGDETFTAKATVADRNIEARESTLLVRTASKFRSNIQLKAEGKTVSAKSIVSVMSLHLRQGMEVEIIAEGSDAQQAAEALRDLINAGIN